MDGGPGWAGERRAERGKRGNTGLMRSWAPELEPLEVADRDSAGRGGSADLDLAAGGLDLLLRDRCEFSRELIGGRIAKHGREIGSLIMLGSLGKPN